MRVTVIGAGVIGLCSAIEAASAGHLVTVVAADTTPRTTSDAAGAIWLPLLNSDPSATSDAYQAELARWSRRSFARLAELVGPGGTGVRYVRNHELFRTAEQPPDYLADILPGFEAGADDGLPADFTFRWSFTTLAIEVQRFLPWLMDRARDHRIELQRQRITSLAERLPGDPDVIVNCTGLGARDLVPDSSVRPVKGQLLLHDPIPYDTALGAYDYGILPRTDALVLGSLFDEEFDELGPTEPDTDRIWAEISRWERKAPDGIGLPPGVLCRSRIRRVQAGLRPFRGSGVRLEADGESAPVPVVHNYGHGASGFTLAWGCAESVVSLLRSL